MLVDSMAAKTLNFEGSCTFFKPFRNIETINPSKSSIGVFTIYFKIITAEQARRKLPGEPAEVFRYDIARQSSRSIMISKEIPYERHTCNIIFPSKSGKFLNFDKKKSWIGNTSLEFLLEFFYFAGKDLPPPRPILAFKTR